MQSFHVIERPLEGLFDMLVIHKPELSQVWVKGKETYRYRHHLKSWGGQWDADRKAWCFDECFLAWLQNKIQQLNESTGICIEPEHEHKAIQLWSEWLAGTHDQACLLLDHEHGTQAMEICNGFVLIAPWVHQAIHQTWQNGYHHILMLLIENTSRGVLWHGLLLDTQQSAISRVCAPPVQTTEDWQRSRQLDESIQRALSVHPVLAYMIREYRVAEPEFRAVTYEGPYEPVVNAAYFQ